MLEYVDQPVKLQHLTMKASVRMTALTPHSTRSRAPRAGEAVSATCWAPLHEEERQEHLQHALDVHNVQVLARPS